MDTEESPKRIDFEPGVYGLNYETEGRYLGEVYSQKWGNGPTCIYQDGEKRYRLTSGLVEGVQVEGEYFVYELDLRETGLSISDLSDAETMKKAAEEARGRITRKLLQLGVDCCIEPGVLHQACGKGILRIEVPSGYEEGKIIETELVDLSTYFQSRNE